MVGATIADPHHPLRYHPICHSLFLLHCRLVRIVGFAARQSALDEIEIHTSYDIAKVVMRDNPSTHLTGWVLLLVHA